MRIATAVLIVLASSVVLAQQLAPPPLVVPRREAAPQPLFPVVPSLAAPAPATSSDKPWFVPESRPHTTPARFPAKRSGVVCMKTVWVDPSIDPDFVRVVPETGLTLRRIEVPPCVTFASDQQQQPPQPAVASNPRLIQGQ